MPPKTKPSADTKTVFYARVSTRDQKADLQLDAARRLGIPVEHIFVEKASGIRHDRPVLEKALATLNAGDTLACYKLDRIGRSLVHVASAPKAQPASSSCMCSAPWLNSSVTSSWSEQRLALRLPRSAGSASGHRSSGHPKWPRRLAR